KWVSADAWLGPERRPAPRLETWVRRYLAAFGPASVQDLQTWSGLTHLAGALERLRPKLRRWRSEGGAELWDTEDAGGRPPEDAPAPVRLLAPFDNLLFSYADRSRVMDEAVRKRLFAVKNGALPGAVLVDGFVAGSWRVDMDKGKRRAV